MQVTQVTAFQVALWSSLLVHQSKAMNPETVSALIEALEAEINNGGFDQFFFNRAGNRTRETIEALELIGAHKTADIVRRAASKFPGGFPSAVRNERQDQLELVSPDADAFEAYDQDFLRYEEDLARLWEIFRTAR
jgi:hypothetical protein